jgi:hypothetical protein
MSFYQQLMQFSIPERQAIVDGAGLSLGYVHKHMYVSDGSPLFHFHNAVAMDQSSRGAIPFIEHTEGNVDWGFVLKRLRSARRRGAI